MNKILHSLVITGLMLAASGCTRKVNLMSVRLGMDRHADTIEKHQDIYQERSEFYEGAMKKTSSRSARPYPEMKRKLSSMKKSIDSMRKVNQKIDDVKPRFEQFARAKGTINDDNKADWEEYQRQTAEYNALVGELRRHGSLFNSDNRRYLALVKQYNVGPTSLDAVRGEIEDIAREIDGGVSDMEQTVRENRKVLKIVGNTGLDPVLIVKKMKVLDEMDDMLPAVRLMQNTVNASKDQALKGLSGSEEIWTGPGMKGGDRAEVVKDFRNFRERFLKSKTAFDKKAQDFETMAKPTPEAEKTAK